jgi:antitoxin CcdA
MSKVELRVEIDAELLAHARNKGVQLAPAVEAGIRRAVERAEAAPTGFAAAAAHQRGHSGEAEAAGAKWAEDNAEALEAYRRRIEEHGVFGEDLRRW